MNFPLRDRLQISLLLLNELITFIPLKSLENQKFSDDFWGSRG